MSKTIMNFFSGRIRAVFFSLALIVLLASCMDKDDDAVTEPVQVAYVSVYHASPDAPDFDIIVDDRAINVNPFDYTSYSGYLNFFTGNRNIKFNAANASNALIDTTFNFENGKAYSLFAIDRLSNLQALLVVDSAAAPAAGKAMVRFVHLSPDAPAFDVAVSGQNAPLFANNSFKQATPFQEIDANTYSFDIKNAGASDVLLSADDITLTAGHYYTIVTRGFKTPPAGNNNILSVEVL
jgi:hypothetical protein